MKKLYDNKGPKRVHPSPPPPPPPSSSLLSFLPTALLALASSLSPQEQEILAYLLTSQKPKELKQRIKHQKAHQPKLGCSCFGCYKSFWARWDSSPNNHVIHLILDAFEESLESKKKGKSRRKRGLKKKKDEVLVEEMEVSVEEGDDGHDGDDGYDGNGDDDEEEEEEEVGDDDDDDDEDKSSSVRRFMSWIFGIDS